MSLLLIGVPLVIIVFIFKPLSEGKPNRWIGIRTPSSMCNVEFWQLVHRRTMLPTILCGALFVVAVPILALFHLDFATDQLVQLCITFAIMIAWSIWIAFIHHCVTLDLCRRPKNPANQPIESK